MARRKRGYEYQQSLARKWGWDSYYEWRKAGYPHHPPSVAISPKERWRHRTFTSRRALLSAAQRMPSSRVIRIDVWGKPYNDEERWFNVFAKGTVEELFRRIDAGLLSIPQGMGSKENDFKPYSLRWRVK